MFLLTTGILIIVATFAVFKLSQAFISNNNNSNGIIKRVPPGPSWALPLLGHLLHVGRKPHVTFKRWRSRYGPIVSWKMGPKNALVLCEAKLVREMFGKEVASGRDHSPIFDLMTGRMGFGLCDGKAASEQRAFVMRTFKELGLVKGGALENIILDEGQRLVKCLEEKAADSQAVEISGVFTGATLNNMWTIISGENHDWTTTSSAAADLEHLRVFENFTRCINRVAETGLVIAPWLRHVIPGLSGWSGFVKANEEFGRLVEAAVAKRLLASNNDSASTSSVDFIGQYLVHMEGVSDDPESSFYKETGRKNLKSAIVDVVLAGAETTTGALEFAMYYLAHHSGVQVDLQKELDTVIGSRLPSLLDKLPNLEAVVWEVIRLSSHVPIGLPHRLMDAIDEFHGYSIPKDTLVFADIYNVNHDPESWTLPEEFNPARFLNEKGELSRTESVISFSFGRRRCAGESLAKSTLFLFLASIFQKLSVEPVVGDKGGFSLDDVVPGIALRLKPFQVVFKPRT